MSPELEEILRTVIMVLYDQSREEHDESYWDLADELSAIISKMQGDDG